MRYILLSFLQVMCVQYISAETDGDKMFAILSELREVKNTQLECKLTLKEMEDMRSRLVVLENKMELLEDQNRKLNAQLKFENEEEPEKADANNSNLRDHLESKGRQVPLDGHVAFTAGVSVPDLVNLGVHHTIIFDKAISNFGNAYHPHTGIFLAPAKGVYVFSVNLMVKSSHYQYLQLVLDGSLITDMYAGASGTGDFISTMQQWIIEVNKGSEVWVRTGGQGEVHGNMHTGFSGFLLFETE